MKRILLLLCILLVLPSAVLSLTHGTYDVSTGCYRPRGAATGATLNNLATELTWDSCILLPRTRAGSASDNWVISSNLTIPDRIGVVVPKGVEFSISSNVTLMLDCAKVLAGEYQIFSGAGTLTCSQSPTRGFPTAWTGATGDDSTDNSAAFTMATGSGVKHILVGDGTAGIFRITAAMTLATAQRLSCVTGAGAVIIEQQTADTNALSLIDVSGNLVEDCEFRGGSGTGVAVYMDSATTTVGSSFFKRVRARVSGSHGFHLKGTSYCGFEDVEASNNGGNGVYLQNAAAANPDNNTFTRLRTVSNTGIGMALAESTQNTKVFSLDTESNGQGLDVGGAASHNAFFFVHSENNTAQGILVNSTGAGNTFFSPRADSNNVGISLTTQAELYSPLADSNSSGDYLINASNDEASILFPLTGSISDNNGDNIILSLTQTQFKNFKATETTSSRGFNTAQTTELITSQNTQAVSSATTIFTTLGDFGSHLVITGRDTASTNKFMDIVTAGNNTTSPIPAGNILSRDIQGTAAARTYTRSTNALQLAMGASSYDITVYGYTAPDPD